MRGNRTVSSHAGGSPVMPPIPLQLTHAGLAAALLPYRPADHRRAGLLHQCYRRPGPWANLDDMDFQSAI